MNIAVEVLRLSVANDILKIRRILNVSTRWNFGSYALELLLKVISWNYEIIS